MRATGDLSERVVQSISDYEERTLEGETPNLELYRQDLGSDFDAFVSLIEARSAIMDLVEPDVVVEELPREFGPYTLLRVLGRGGAGDVYEARNNRVGRLEAVKLLRSGFARGSTTFERFQREAAACAGTEHPNIAKVHMAGEIDDTPYFAMELIEGSTLKGWARDGHMTSVSDLFARMANVADALDALHRAGVIHRDVKPSNIMVRSDGSFVLMDFGLAHTDLGDTLTNTGEMLGTPYYMGPEQLRGERDKVGPASDVYSIGATLYELLARRPPIQASNVLDLLQRQSSERPQPLSQVAPQVPAAAERIVMMCLEYDPDDRYSTAAALRDDLLAFADERPVAARPISRAIHAARRVIRLAPAITVAAVVVGLLLFGYLTQGATLTLTTEGITAEIILDQHRRGGTPQTFELEAGRHVFRLFADGFDTGDVSVTLARGDDPTLDYPLADLPVARDSQVGLEKLGLAVGLGAVDSELIQRRRGGSDLVAAVLIPAGKIRPQDLRFVRFEIYDEGDVSEGGDILVVRKRGGEELFRTKPNLDLVNVEVEIPQSVRDELRPGDEIEIAYRIGDDEWPQTVTVVPADPELDKELARIDTELAKQPLWVRTYFRSRLLLERELYTAALHEARGAIDMDARPETQPLVPIVMARAASSGMGIPDDSVIGGVLAGQMGAYSQELLDAWVRTKPR